jgi:hypothetical protein
MKMVTAHLNLITILFAPLSASCIFFDDDSHLTFHQRASIVSCDAEMACGSIGLGAQYTTYEDCLSVERRRADRMWPRSRCPDESFALDEFDNCMAMRQAVSCGDDLIAYENACNAGRVCIERYQPQ